MLVPRHIAGIILMSVVSLFTPTAIPIEGPENALAIAKQYADSHYPKGSFPPDRARIQYIVEDAGEVWKIEIGPVGYLGGGLQVLVRKRDMEVVSALRTQ